MEIRAIQPPAIAGIDTRVAAPRTGETGGAGGDFASLIAKSLDRVAGTQRQADVLSQHWQLGQNDVSLEDAMLAMQKANISLQATVQVRNKLVAAYNDIMNMPV